MRIVAVIIALCAQVIVTPDGAVVVDARLRLEAPGLAAPFPSLEA